MRLLPESHAGLARLKLYLALSRTPHGVLDLAAPGLAALVWLGDFPSLPVTTLGLITAFAGYTAVYALNDVIDYRVDKEKMARGGLIVSSKDLDAMLVRHPMAQGLLSFKQGIWWVFAWALLALIGAYILNPVCILIFMAGCILEAVYCLMLKVSYLRTFISGAVKTSGGIAAVFAVDPNPAPVFVVVLFLWLFFWEIGGQNIPNDWTDVEEDRRLHAQTIPVRLGLEPANLMILGSLAFAVILSLVLLMLSQASFGLRDIAAAALIGSYLLLYPGIRLHKTRARQEAMFLFNRASYYPLALLAIVLVKLMA